MPQAAVVAGIQAGATIVAGVLSSRASGRASDRQYRATQDAIALQRELEARRQKEYDDKQAELKKEWDAYVARRQPYWDRADALIRGSGGATPNRPTAMPEGWTPEGTGNGATRSAGASSFRAPFSSGATLPTAPGAGSSSSGFGSPLIPQSRFRANWNDWENYGA